ncbi:MAG: hypothetical protein OXU77_20880 [Gammaproteobacteria bacterium]|nr:hypothetical protein [Gammaproteobacteria bacterium]
MNPQTLVDELVFPPQLNDTLSETATINAFVRGEVYELPAGSIQLVLGTERRSKVLDFQYRTTDTRLALTNNGLGIQGFRQATNLDDQSAERTVDAFYAEFFVPLAKDLPLATELAVTLSGRTETADGNANLDYRLRYRVETRFGAFSMQANVTKVIAYNRLDSQNDDAGRLRRFVGPNARELSACSENDLQSKLQTLTDMGFEVLKPIEHDAANSSFFCQRHVAEIVATGNRIPKYSQHLNLGWEYRGLRLNVDLSHREDASQLGGGRTAEEWVTQNYPVSVNLTGAYDFDAGGWFGAPGFLRGTTLRFGINDLLDHRVKITFDGETDNEYNQGVSFLDYSNRSYYVEIAATIDGLLR